MKKIILIGEMNDVMRSVYEGLISENEFSVQLCAGNEESIKGLIRIYSPDMAVLGDFGTEDIDDKIFELFSEKYDKLPVLVIAEEEKRSHYESYCTGQQFELLLRPTTNLELLNRCRKMIEMEQLQQAEEINPAEGLEQAAKNVQSAGEEVTKKKILVVDDSPLLLRNIKSLLEEKYTVFLANSGEQALAFIPKKEPDLVLLDYEMPGMNGKETLEAMLADDYAKNIPVIFLTSISLKEQILDVLKYCPADYILKPPSKDELFARIEAVINNVVK